MTLMSRRLILQSGSAAALLPTLASLPAGSADLGHGLLNVFQFGAVGDGKADDTQALQRGVDAATRAGRTLHIPAGTYRCGGISIDLAGGNLGSGLTITGDAARATRLVATSNNAVISVTAHPVPTEANVTIGQLSITGFNRRAPGLQLRGLAHLSLDRVIAEDCSVGLDCRGVLVMAVRDCTFQRSESGAVFRKDGVVHANAITLDNCRFNLNSRHGIDFGEGSLLRIRDCQIEANGTQGRLDSGGVVLRDSLTQEYGYAIIVIDGCWLERNYGWSVLCERNPGLQLSLRDSQILSSEKGRSLRVSGASHCLLDNVLLPSPGDIADITCDRLSIIGGVIARIGGIQQAKSFTNTAFEN